jgi:hypothetical protein
MYVPSISATGVPFVWSNDGDQRLVRVPVRVLREERDELARKPRRRQVRGIAPSRPFALGERGDARRHRRLALAQLAVRVGERVDERVEVEQLLAPPAARAGSREPLEQAERLLVPGHAVRDAGAADALPVREVPVVRLDQRVLVRQPRLPAEHALRADVSTNESLCAVL